jgi:chromosome segregation ATPase
VRYLSKPWTKQETKFLFYWVKQGQMYGYHSKELFRWIARQLGRSEEECQLQWRRSQPSYSMAQLQSTDSHKETEELKIRLKQLEEKLNQYRQKTEQISEENKRLKRDIRFFEMVLLEEYQLLLQLLNQEGKPFRIHSTQIESQHSLNQSGGDQS